MKTGKQKKIFKSRVGVSKEKRNYQKPQLKKYGSITELTGCGGGATTDVFFAGSEIC